MAFEFDLNREEWSLLKMMIALVHAISIDCENVIKMAFGMNMHLTTPTTWTSLNKILHMIVVMSD